MLHVALPLAERADVDAARAGDDLIVSVGAYRRVITLPSALRRVRGRPAGTSTVAGCGSGSGATRVAGARRRGDGRPGPGSTHGAEP